MNQPKHYVVVRLSALGDVILTTGVLRYWHERHGWTFTVITRGLFGPLFEGHPAVREVVLLQDDDMRGSRLRQRLRWVADTYKGHTLIDLHGIGRTRLLGWLWKGPVARYDKKSLARRVFLATGGRVGRACLIRENVPQRYALAMELSAPLPEELAPVLYLTPEETRDAYTLAESIPGYVQDGPLVALHPYAAHRGKTVSSERWQELMEMLNKQGIPWCVIGQANAEARLGGIPDGRDLTNRCHIRQTAALVSLCSVLVTGDSGPMHVSAAVGTPVVALFGSTTREWGFYPTGPRHTVIELPLSCRPCSLHGSEQCNLGYACMNDIALSDVFLAIHSAVCTR